MVDVSIVIPTQRRPAGLDLAVRSVLAQQGLEGRTIELIVADNDAVPSAQALVDALSRSAPFAVSYVHEPQAGVANVRNRALSVAAGSFIAFLDDDEEAPVEWLSHLMRVQAEEDAAVVFGPVRARTPASVVEHKEYIEAFFSRMGPENSGAIRNYYGCGNSLLRRSDLPFGPAPFDTSRNHIGGEDDLLFSQMQKQGKVMAWAAEAFVWEDPVPDRLNLDYTLRRAFAYGQGPASSCAAHSPPDLPGIAFWMAVGVAQTLGYGVVAVWHLLARTPRRAHHLDKVARGVGKIVWWTKIKFYGRTQS